MPRIEGKPFLLLWLVAPVVLGVIYGFFLGDPVVLKVVNTAFFILILFFSVVVHEMSHGLGAAVCGDPTAQSAGRLTFNPVSHVSVVGTIIVPLVLYLINPQTMLGWAKFVPFNPVNLRKYPRDQIFLVLAGPLSNFALAVFFFGLFMLTALALKWFSPESSFGLEVITPISPNEGHSFGVFWLVLLKVSAMGILTNLGLGVFNLVPFPPLDGYWILRSILPRSVNQALGQVGPLGFVLLILAVHFDLLTFFFYPIGNVMDIFLSFARFILSR